MTTLWKPEGELATPYRRARQEWDDRMGGAVVHAKNWRLACFGSLGLVALSLLGLIYLGAQPKAVPHIIEVDKLGAARYLGPVGDSHYVPSDAAITYHLRRFLSDTREVSSDAAINKRAWLDAYTLVTPRGAHMLSAWVQAPEHDPFRRMATERVTIEVVSAVRATGDTWQVDWRESTFDKDGNPAGPVVTWRAMLRTLMQPPKTAEAMSRNPLGLFIDEIHWNQVGVSE